MRVKETLKDAAQREYTTMHEIYQYNAFIEGAEWHQEIMCSDEIINLIRYSLSNAEARRIIKEKTK